MAEPPRQPRAARPESSKKLGRAAAPMTTRHRRLRLAKKIAIWTGVGALVAAALVSVMIVFVFWYYDKGLPDLRTMDDYHPKQVTVILDAKGERIGEIYPEQNRRSFVPYDQVPKIVIDAFVASEDERFWTHAGIDYRGMVRAFFTNLRSGETKQGASTITQQVVKTFVLSPERTFKRKIQEIILARRLEKRLSKQDILTLYVNQVYFGHGRYGVQEASRFYFGKDVKDVTVPEAAVLAMLVQSPNNLSPIKHPEVAKDKQIGVLNKLARLGKISREEAQKWIDAPIQVVRDPYPHIDDAPEWVEVVRNELEAEYGKDKLDTLGATVRTTMRPNIQVAAQAALQSALRAVDTRHKLGRPVRSVKPDKIAAELAKLAKKRRGDPKAGETYEAVVTAVHADGGGELEVDLGDWKAALPLGRADDDRWNPAGEGGKRKAPGERFAVGDVIKVALPAPTPPGEDPPAKPRHGSRAVRLAPGPEGAVVVLDPHTREVLALVGGFDSRAGDFNRALSAKRQPGSSFKPIVYAAALASKRFTPATIVNDAPEVYDLWKPQNYKKGAFEGPVRLRYALAKSINTVAIKVIHDIGPQAAADLAKQLGITGPLPVQPSLALGSGEVTPLELTNAFATFAAGGVYAPPRFVARINGKDRAPSPGTQALPPDVAYVVTDMMRSVVEQGTATKAKSLKLTLAGKTGTSNDARDTWFVGMTPDVVVGVWIGYDAPLPMGSGETGGVTALPAFIDTMKAVGAKNRPFPKPAGITTVTIDKITGLVAAAGAPAQSILAEVFLAGTEPTEVAPLPGEIDASTFVVDEYGDEAPRPQPGGDGAGPVTAPD